MNNVVPLHATDSRVLHPQHETLSARLTKTWAIAGVVIKEMYRRKDFYVLFILTLLISVALGSVNFFGDDKIVRYLKEICLLLIFLSTLVISITAAARQLPAEREARTLFPLLAKPVSRGEVVQGKFLGCWLASGLSLLCFYFFFGLLCGWKEHQWPILAYGQAMLLHWMLLGIVIAMTLLGSVFFTAPSSNTTILMILCVGILGVGRHLNKVAAGLPEPLNSIVYGIYFAIPHLEFFDVRELVVHNWELIQPSVLLMAVVYGALYISFFLGLTCVRFRRQALN